MFFETEPCSLTLPLRHTLTNNPQKVLKDSQTDNHETLATRPLSPRIGLLKETLKS